MREPFECIALDIVGPPPHSRRGNQYILVICDYATRCPEALPIHFIDAGIVAEQLIQLFAKMGIPKEIFLDQGTNFMFYNLLQIHLIRTSPYHPQTDALAKVFNKTLKSLLRKLVNKEGRDWDRLLPYVCLRIVRSAKTLLDFPLLSSCMAEKIEAHLMYSKKCGKLTRKVVRVSCHTFYWCMSRWRG